MRPLVFLVPVYIGSLKYYAKILPHLAKFYDVKFLIVRRDDERRAQMVTHCKEKGYPYIILDAGLSSSRFPIPFFSPVFKHTRHILACRKILSEHKPIKIVATRAVRPNRVLLGEAMRVGIGTIILQWAMTGEKHLYTDRKSQESFYRRGYYSLISFLLQLSELALGHKTVSRIEDAVDKVGLIDEIAFDIYPDKYGFSKEKCEIVGMADFQMVNELKKKIDSDSEFRKALLQKYTLDNGRKNIVVLAWHYHKKKSSGIPLDEHLAYYRYIFETLRKIFPESEANLLFKLHPSDKRELYDDFKALRVKVFADESSTEELICLSDLCISDPWTFSFKGRKETFGCPKIFLNSGSSKAGVKITILYFSRKTR